MSKRMNKVQKMENIYLTSKNKELLDSFIDKYRTETKSSLLNLFNVCETLRQLDDCVKNLELSEEDLDYFCHSVLINKKGSTYRKYVCIGKKVDLLREYIETLPSTVSTIYEICTLDSDKFEELVNQELITNTTTLNELKRITGKLPIKTKQLSPSKCDNFVRLDFEFKSLSVNSRKNLLNFINQINSSNEFKVICTLPKNVIDKPINVIDVETIEVMEEDEVLV